MEIKTDICPICDSTWPCPKHCETEKLEFGVKSYRKGYIDMIKSFSGQLEKAIDETGKKQHLNTAQKIVIKASLESILFGLKKSIAEGENANK